jgi:hypothetical protein
MDSRTYLLQCKEITVAAVIMAAFALGTILTAEMFGHVTVDEVSYSDPAINLVMNGTLTSSAWYSQRKEEFWASNTPLHQFVLAGCLKLFGFSIHSVQGFSAFMVCAAGSGFWLFLRWAGFIATHACNKVIASLAK